MSTLPINPLLDQFLSEAGDLLENIGTKLMQLEDTPGDESVLNELFRCVHTLKGNSGLFTFPEMTRVLHAAEDLLGMVRSGHATYSRAFADPLLEAMDFVGLLCSGIESTDGIDASHAAHSKLMADELRKLTPVLEASPVATGNAASIDTPAAVAKAGSPLTQDASRGLAQLPDAVRTAAVLQCEQGEQLHWITYRPDRECFFRGDDPLLSARRTPGRMWGRVVAPKPIPSLAELDTYSCMLEFDLLTNATRHELDEYFRYLTDQVEITPVTPSWLVQAQGDADGEIEVPAPRLQSFTEHDTVEFRKILAIQREILLLEDRPAWHTGRLKAVAEVLTNLGQAAGDVSARSDVQAALAEALATGDHGLLLEWLDRFPSTRPAANPPARSSSDDQGPSVRADENISADPLPESNATKAPADDRSQFGRRAEDSTAARTLKVDQAKVDRLMNLIGELVVSKNALPYLAQRAEAEFGVRELSLEIKCQYAGINRIAEEMQDAIMQVRMMAVSGIFQRFPRLVRDTSRKLGKEVQLVLEGEHTEADKNIIESLADPLIHIIRNSLDHGLETPEVRLAAGKPATGKLTIRAAQQSDRVVIEIIDDGKGIDPAVIKRKAYEKGIIDEAALERMSDQEAINLIFAAGLSTAQVISDLSGRGVGMDVVRSAVEKINGTVQLFSEVGNGTTIRISLPLSMAVTHVMVVESDHQLFGVPMEHVIETVRLPRSAIRSIKQSQTAVLRGRIIPLKSLNEMLGIAAIPQPNSDDELAVLLVREGSVELGLLVDGFQETTGVIQKPLQGFLSKLSAYSGSALMGNGSVLMILNMREII